MNKQYVLEMNYHEDINRNIDCLTLSIGANSIEQFEWIENNLLEFKNRSMKAYNVVLQKYKQLKEECLYLVISEKKEKSFSLMERYLGLFHKYKEMIKQNKEVDVYLDETIRMNFFNVDKLNNLSLPSCAEVILIFSTEKRMKEIFQEFNSRMELFDFFYNSGNVIIEVNDFFSEGNSLTFFSKEKKDLELIIACAREEGFKDI